MIHLGDITKINGAEIEPVDCITGGSPCQDLSVAGKRAGLAGERSGLFMEQIRIVKEMREEERKRGRPNHLCRPRYMVWENVPGAFSSNGGRDFQAVITEIVKVVEPDAHDIPLPEKGKWPKADAYFGVGADGTPFSIAYRVHNAQFWGVPQHRRRIALVADFGGLSAPEILFERKGLSGGIDESQPTGKETAGGLGGGPAGADRAGEPLPLNTMLVTRDKALGQGTGLGVGMQGAPQFTLSAAHEHAVCCPVYGIDEEVNATEGIFGTLLSHGTGGQRQTVVYDEGVMVLNDQGGSVMDVSVDKTATLRAQDHGHPPVVCMATGQAGAEIFSLPVWA